MSPADPTPKRSIKNDPAQSLPKSYFVDEAGDLTIYDSRGNFTVGSPGVSKFFMIGFVDVPDPIQTAADLKTLHNSILTDTRFQNLPSMQPKAKKTAFGFHAKDDVAAIRDLVYDFISQQNSLRFFAVVREKSHVSRDYTNRRKHYNGNDLYDHLVSRLFKEHLHKAPNYDILFASRGKKDRTSALYDALEDARTKARKSWGVNSTAPINIQAMPCRLSPCLQIADYCLWAVQRLFEQADETYIQKIGSIIHKIHDIDDRRKTPYGVYYGQKNFISAAKISRN